MSQIDLFNFIPIRQRAKKQKNKTKQKRCKFERSWNAIPLSLGLK